MTDTTADGKLQQTNTLTQSQGWQRWKKQWNRIHNYPSTNTSVHNSEKVAHTNQELEDRIHMEATHNTITSIKQET